MAIRLLPAPLICAILGAAVTATSSPVIRFASFASSQRLNLVDAATISKKNVLRLTSAKRDKTGAAWLCDKQPILNGFTTTFQFQVTHQAHLWGGADGFAFVIQNSGPRAIGGRGSAGGFGVADASNANQPGIPWSFAVFFDTGQNQDEGDPSANYIAIRTTGRPAEMHWPADRLAFTSDLAVNLKDGRVHTARIVYHRPVIQVFLDNSTAPVLQTTVDLSLAADPQGKAWIGFTASTGWGSENHDILSWSFQSESISSNISVVSSEITFPMSACLPNHNLCTPEHSFVARTGNKYHVVLPADVEWPVRIPNPDSAKLVITNAHGTACWDVKDLGFNGCTGPGGKTGPAGADFLDTEAPAGALITRTHDGFTLFSVNGQTEAGFQNNEGFYEFDVEVR